jgi:hypothetical protein
MLLIRDAKFDIYVIIVCPTIKNGSNEIDGILI